MVPLARAAWPVALERATARERGTVVTVRHQAARGEPGLVVIWALSLARIALDSDGALVIIAGSDPPVTFRSHAISRLLVQATPDRRRLALIRAELDDGSAVTVEFHRE